MHAGEHLDVGLSEFDIAVLFLYWKASLFLGLDIELSYFTLDLLG